KSTEIDKFRFLEPSILQRLKVRLTFGPLRDVIFVDNLNDSGPGSLRAACEVSGPRTVVFRVSGNIELDSPIWIEDPYITIAGQTAPGEGICLKGWGLRLRTSDVVIRFIRSRPGVDRTTAVTGCISGDYSRDIIIDHCSTSWASDEGISINKDVDRHTVQWCIIAENLGDHGFGSILGSYAGDISYHHNLYVSNVARMPRPAGWVDYPGKVYWEFVNNVVHNFGHTIGYNGNYGYDGDVEAGNLVGNAYTSGPDSTTGNIYRHVEPYSELYASDNIYNGVQAGWTRMAYESGISENDTRVNQPFTISGSIETESAQNVTSSVLAKVGATYPRRDSVDERLIAEVIAGTGSLVADASGLVWPTLNSISPPADDDNDGIPNYWETQYSVSDINGDTDFDGYTNLEEYLNNTNPTGSCDPIVYVVATDSRANEAGDAGEFTVFRIGSTSGALTVNYTVSGSATAISDYTNLSGSVTIPGGASKAAITVIPVDDSNTEEPEQVIIKIDTDSNYKIGLPAAALVVIVDYGGNS
ncbi:MAG: hypothetical protein JW837_04960, partial [Sedimentisphaerales bacterium]|nr:hypothetical protein [Sedimentisphaerales bacterium]